MESSIHGPRAVMFAVILTPRTLRKGYKSSPTWIKTKFLNRVYDEDFGLNGFNEFIQEIEDALVILRKSPFENFLSLILIGFH